MRKMKKQILKNFIVILKVIENIGPNDNVNNGTENVYFSNFITNFKNFVKQYDFKKVGIDNPQIVNVLELSLEGDYLSQFNGTKY